jgi:cytochrome c-type biogenesis protein CcmF
VFLVLAAFVVFVGTLAPIVNDWLGMPPISIGRGWFAVTFPVVGLPLFVLVAIGIHAAWKRGRLGESRKRLLLGFGIALVGGAAVLVGVYGAGLVRSYLGFVIGIWIIVSSLFDPVDRLRRRLSLPRAVLGMTVAHIGLGVLVIAVSTVESYSIERTAALRPGEAITLGDYAYRLDAVRDVQGPNYIAKRAEITVLRDGKPVTTLYPEKREYWVQASILTEASIQRRWNKDLFAVVAADLQGGAWSVGAQVRPLIGYVWFAAVLMALGGIFAATDRRYRSRATASEPAPAEASEARAS